MVESASGGCRHDGKARVGRRPLVDHILGRDRGMVDRLGLHGDVAGGAGFFLEHWLPRTLAKANGLPPSQSK